MELIEYMKLHLISLEQDSEKIQSQMNEFVEDFESDEYKELEIEDISTNGQIIASRHILSVANDIINDLLTGE